MKQMLLLLAIACLSLLSASFVALANEPAGQPEGPDAFPQMRIEARLIHLDQAGFESVNARLMEEHQTDGIEISADRPFVEISDLQTVVLIMETERHRASGTLPFRPVPLDGDRVSERVVGQLLRFNGLKQKPPVRTGVLFLDGEAIDDRLRLLARVRLEKTEQTPKPADTSLQEIGGVIEAVESQLALVLKTNTIVLVELPFKGTVVDELFLAEGERPDREWSERRLFIALLMSVTQ